MPQDKPLYTLYKGLRANNYDVPDNYASFERTLTEAGEGGAKSRHTLYRALKSQNYDVPDTYERFYNTLFDVVNKTTSRAKPAPSSPSRPRPSAHAAPAGQRQRAIAGVKNTAGKILGITQQMAHQVESARPVPRKPKTPAKPLTAAQKQQMIAGAQAAVDNVAAGNSRVANQIAFANANLGLQANPARLGQNGRVAVRGADGKVRKPQPAPIGMDLADTYVTESGNEYSDRSAADREQNALDAIRYNREHRREYLEAQKRRIEQEMNQRGKELDAEALDFSWRDMPRGSGGAVHTYNSSTANERFADTRYMALSAQLSQVNDALGVLDEAEHGKASDAWINNSSNWFERKGKQLLGFGAGAWRGLAHAVGRVNTWDLGMTDLTTNAAMYNAAINHDKGKATKEERDLLDLAAYAKGVRAENEKYIGYGYEAGEVTGESLPFMIEMMMNPASGLGKTAANQIMRVAVKKYGKEAVRRATKKYLAAKIGTRILGDVAGSAIMAGTSGQGRVHADALNRLTGDVKFKEDENGQIVYDGRKGAEDNVVDAYLKAFGAQTIENHSEMLGEYFAPLLGRAASVTRKGMERIGLGSVNRFIDDVGATNAARMLKDFEGRAKWNGIIGEYAEEVLGNVENALVVGDMTLDTNEQTGVFNKDQNIRTFLGVGLMGGFLSGVKTASYRGPKRQALNDMAAAGKAVDEAAAGNDKMREKWADWRIKLLVGSEEEKVSTLREVMDDEQLPMGFRMGVLNFSKAAQKYEGLVRAQKSKKEEGAQDAVDESYDESYDNGYDTTDPSAMHEAKVQLDAAREKLTKKLNGASTPEEANKIIDDPLEYIHAQRAAGASVEDLQEVVDYANAKSAFDGMLQRVRDDIDGRVDESDSMVDSRVNKDTGMITRATMKVGDRQVYVVDGIVAMHEDGSMVDVNNSSESILVRDAQTGKLEWASPHDILSVDEGVKPEEEKAAAAEAIRQEVAGTAAAQIDGVADGATAETQGPAAQSQPATEATAANEAPVATAEAHESGPAYALNDEITLYNEKGEPVHGVVNAEENEDGLIEVYTDRPINGNRINLYSREELDRMAGNSGIQSSETEAAEPTDAQVGSSTEAGAVEPAVASTENEQPMVEPQPAAEEQPQVEAQPSEEVRPSALERVPKDEQGQPVYEMAEPGTAWDAIVEQTGGDEQMAQTVAESMVADKKAALKKAEKAKARQGGTIAEKIAAEQERKAAIEQAKAELAHWQNIAMMQQQRRSEAERAKEEAARKAAEEKAAEEARLKAEHEEAERKEREALDGVPDWTEDTAQNARARGFRRSNGGKYDRQGPVAALQGKEVEVKFADQVKQKARVAVMEAGALQPSHHNGQPNVLHFIPEAQPKKRTDEASVSSSENMARNINPEEITSSVTAYTGAPTVNSRGEVIQGNNRSAALKTMWQSHAEQAEKYKQYLMEHAEEFGLNAEDIARMENPVLVNMADVDDEKAIELGQYDVKDTESGGTERIKPKNAVMKMGGDMKTFAARLLSSSDEEASFSQLVDANGVDVLKWMSQKGFITPTQYKSAFDSKGNLTAEAANDLKGIMYQSIFQNGSERLEEMFNTLPAKAQRALLATAYRDFDSPESERMVPEIQQSIMAYHALMLDDAFANAKTMKEAQTAILMWQRQYQFDDATGESYLPTNKFSNFALQLAAMYKVQTQRLIQGTFNQMYDLIQGTQEADLFNQDTLDNTPRSLVEAIKEVLNIDYNGQQGSNVLGGRDATGQPGRQGSSGAADADGRGEEGERPAEREGGAEATDDNSSKNESQAGQKSIGLGHDGRGRVEGVFGQRQGDLAETEKIKLSDEIDPNGRQFVLTSEGELAFGEIGEDTGLTTAPILLSEGMITNPATNDGYGLAHIEARHGDQIRKAGYKSVVDFIETVAKNYDVIKEGNLRDGHQTYRLQLTDKHNNTLMIELSGDGTYWNINTAGIFKTSYGKKNKEVYSRHTTAKQPVEAAETSQDAEQRDTQASSSMNVPTSSKGKVTYKESTSQENDDKSLGGEEKTPLSAKIDEASAEVNTEPTEAQKEAGNYKKGHVQVGTFDITIEQPQGSVRKGTDANGKQWESKMHNTYGYIRGTIGVDGDHIDVFLSNDIDGWNGRKVFVVDQYNPDGSFDEHKVMLGFNDADEAKSDYLANYEDGWEKGRRIDVTAVNLEDFEKWMESSKRKTKPFSEYKAVADAQPLSLKDMQEAAGDAILDEKTEAEKRAKAEKKVEPSKADDAPIHNDEVQSHDWSQYKEGDVFDIYGHKAIFKHIIRDENGKVTGVAVYQLDENGKPFGSEDVPPLMFLNEYKAEKPKAKKPLLIKGEKWEATGEPAKFKARTKKHADSHDVLWTIGKKRYGSTVAERDLIETAIKEYGGYVEAWNAYERGEIILSENEAAILKASIEEIEKRRGGGQSPAAGKVRLQKDEGYSEFAAKHGVSVDDVKRYAEGMALGNLALANQALASMRVAKRHEHRGPKLSEFAKIFSPIKKDLYERFGNMDELHQEFVNRAEEERNMMKAARRKAEETERKRLARLEELSLLDDAAVDERYMEALEKGDEAAAMEMLDEAARRKGYGDTTSDYQGVGAWAAPSDPGYESDAARRADMENNTVFNVEDMALGYSSQPSDYFEHPERYAQDTPYERESRAAIVSAMAAVKRGDKNVKIKVYRAVPTSVKEGKLRNGDWVTPSKKYAEIHGNNRLKGKYRIIEDEVPVSELWWDSNDVNEWGYDNGKEYKYKNVKNNRKSDALVTRDDKGNVIVPSKRFNQRKADERYQRGVGDVKPSKAEVALRDAVIDRLRENGMEVIADVAEGQKVLDEANGRDKLQMGDTPETFAERQKQAVENRGVVMPGLNETYVEVVKDIPRHGYTGSIAEATKQAIQKAKEKYAPAGKAKVLHYDNNGAEFDYVISGNAIEICLSPKHQAKSGNKGVHLALAEHLDEVIDKSVEVEEHPDYIKGKDGKRGEDINPNAIMHRFYGIAIIDGVPCRVMTLMREDVRREESKGIHSYEVQKIEVLDNDLPSTSNGVGTPINEISAYPLAKLLKGVEKSYDKGKKLLEESEKSSTDLREQRVYHGSGADFEAFDHGHMGEGQGSQVFGWGTYVTSSKAIGESYAQDSAMGDSPRMEMEYTGDALTANEVDSVKYAFNGGMRSYHEVEKFLEKIANSDKPGAKHSANVLSLLRKTKPDDWTHPLIGKRQLYTVEIPEDNGSNYLDWENPLNDAQKEILKEGLMAAGVSVEDFKGLGFTLDSSFKYVYSASLPMMLRGVHVGEADNVKEKASRFLSGLGFTGIKYPAGTIHGGAEKGDMNYVIFNEKDAKITDHVRFFRTANGEAYGFTVGGKIYVDPRIATSETPVHEYAHLWTEALRNGNPKEWQNVVELMKGSKVWDEVKKRYPELKTDDEIADEVIATYSGRRGAERLREEQRKIADGNGGAFEKAEAISALERVKDALKKFWKGVADFLHIHYKNAEEVADRVMKDLLEGVDPRKMGETKDGGVRFSAKQKRALETASLVNATRSLTVVSSATGAKILNSIDKLVESLEKSATQPKTFIGNVAKALGASRFGSGSEYATFETKNGDIVTIRLANHNAHVSGFDHNGKDNGISIVISPKPNEGITNDGNAHITEFYYDSIKLRRAKGKPLAEIVRSIKQALYSGEFKDTTGLAERQEVNGRDVIRYQFIGEKGAAAADHAEEVSIRLDNLSVAREMEAEKKDAKVIKLATGWERGADGKWRYEIADMKYFGKGDAGYQKAREKQPWSKELDGLSDRILNGEELPESVYQRFDELAQNEDDFKTDYLNREKPHLADWVENDELFNAYPDLKRVKMVFTYQMPANVGGSYNEREHTIVVNTNYVGGIASVLAHEIQHAIQHIEGFARGGSPERMKSDFLEAKAEWAARAYAHELEETAKALGENYNQLAVEQALIKEYEDMDMSDWLPDKDTRIKGFNYFARGYADRSLDDAIKRFRLSESTRDDFNPYVEYSRLAGEVEARNVQKRMDISAWERMVSLAAETEDVAREDQIFLMRDGVLRDGDGVYSDEDLSLANDPSSKLLGESRYSATQRQAFAARTRKNMADHAKELAERLHLDNVEVVTDASTLSGRRQKAKGFYNKRTGKITIVVGNHLDLADVEQTVLHEAVAHYGLRKLFGEHFDTFLDNVFMHADLPIRQRITELARRHGWDFRTATEEYLANLAEDTDFEHLSSGFYGWWSYVKDAFLSMLHKIGFREYDGPSLSDNELRYILWRSYENLKEPGRFRSILGEAEDVTRQSKLKVGNYAERRETDESHAAEPLEAMPVKEDVNEINQKFNDELQKQLDGTLPSNHIYKMGRPGSVLLSTGVPDLPIQMSASRLKTKATSYGHDFDLGEVKDLVKALQNPLAVFSYGDKTKAQNIIVPLQKDGKNFIVGLSLNPTVGGRSLEINSIRNVFPKNNSEWLNWIAQGKALFLDKEKIQTLIDQQRTILADVTYLDLDSVAKVVKDFVNPKVSDENVADEDVLFRDGDDVEYEKAQARMMYERRVRSGLYQTQEAMLDSMLGLKEAMSSVLKAEKRYTGKIEDVAGFENAYLGENRLSSVNQAECEAFTRLLLNPLLKEISKLARDAAERADLTDYMMAKHGLERNRVMAERDAKKAFEEYQKEHPKGTKTLQDFIDANRKRDYAGLTALTGIPEVEDAEVEAQVMVDEYERDHDTTELWDKVNAVTKATLQKSYESGFLNKATYDSIRSMYDNYIPLRGFDEKTSDEVYAYLSEKHSAFNAPIKTARGRKSKADDPLANMMTMAESAIMQGNRNVLVKQRFLNFVLNHPSDLVSVSDLWLRYDDVTGEWHPVNTGDVAGTERIEEDDSPSEVARKMEDFEQAMSQLAESDPDHFVRQKEHPSIPYRVVEGRDLRQHQVLVKRNGKDFILTINGNPRAAQALNGQTNPDNDVSGSIGKLLGVVGDVNRTLSMLYTTLQPDFVASNFLRDTLYANTMVWAKETPRYAARFNKNYALTKRVMHLLGKYRKGTLNMGNETEKMFYQFMKHGGETGFFRMADIDQHKEEVDRVLKGLNEKIPARKIRKYLTEWIGEIGRGIEMRARFAAFITSRQEGRSIDRSVWDAKEISVNFNKKGAGDKFLGENGQTRIGNAAAGISGLGRGMFIFWNAALQGTFSNFGKYAARHPGKMAAVAATNFALGLLVSALASAGGGDDDDSYFDLPEHTRRQNLVIRGPGKTWVKIPLPMEYRAIYGMGELAGSTLLHNDPLDAGKLAGQVSQLLPVDLMEGFGGLWPSSVKPAWETYKNETWYGRPIWKETPFNTPAPQWTKAFDSTNPDLVNLASALNEASGGSDYKKGSIDLNPAAIEYLMKQYTGGFFTVVNQLRNLASASLGKKDFDWRYVPLANRMLMTGGDERNANQGLNEKFFNYMDIYKAKEFEVSAITNDMSLSFDQRAALIGEIATDADYIVLRRASAQYESLYEAYRIAKDRGDQVEQNRLGLKIKELKRSLVKEMEGDKTGSNNK